MSLLDRLMGRKPTTTVTADDVQITPPTGAELEALPIEINASSRSPAVILRHYMRIGRCCEAIAKEQSKKPPSLKRVNDFAGEINRRQKQLAAIGRKAPKNIREANAMALAYAEETRRVHG